MNNRQAKYLKWMSWRDPDMDNRKLVTAGIFLFMVFLLSSGMSGTQMSIPPVQHLAHTTPLYLHRPMTKLTSMATPTPNVAEIASQADQLLTGEVTQQEFSGAVLLMRDGQVVLNKGYSMANWDQQIANTPHTRFYLGSTTKQFTAMAILILQERGKLHLWDSICTYISSCPPTWLPVTLHEILTHTSGLPALDDTNLPETSPEDWFAGFNGVPLAFTPGSQFSYCNICYQILAYVVEKVSGEAYSAFLQQAIFTPLQMRNSGTGDANYTSVPDHAIGYASWQTIDGTSGMDVDPQWSFLFGSGLVYSSAEDMYRWDQALTHHTLVSQQTLDKAFTCYIASQYAGSCYGYGWFVGHAPVLGHRLIWHDGKIPGFRTYIGRYPDDKTTLIILSNLAPVDEVILASQLEKIIFAH